MCLWDNQTIIMSVEVKVKALQILIEVLYSGRMKSPIGLKCVFIHIQITFFFLFLVVNYKGIFHIVTKYIPVQLQTSPCAQCLQRQTYCWCSTERKFLLIWPCFDVAVCCAHRHHMCIRWTGKNLLHCINIKVKVIRQETKVDYSKCEQR